MSTIRSSPGRMRFALAVGLAVLVVWVVAGALAWYAVSMVVGWPGRGYARVELATGRAVWVELRGRRARVAASGEELASAPWASVRHDEPGSFRGPVVELPLGGQGPSGWQKVELGFEGRFGETTARWWLTRRGDDGASWTYVVEATASVGGSLERPATIRLPRVTPVTLYVVTDADTEGAAPEVGVALAAETPDGRLIDVRRNGDPDQARVRVFDEKGKVVASAKGSLDEFGFT